ncbi:MAG: hypothetical protein DCF26_17115 [Burkholderiales bacterium]|nr:MAG: hypothetical protein DCF26_17115 [Burkholderiales bacterium]
MENRTAITTSLWIKLCISAVVATLLTLLAVSITWGGMAPVAGKPLLLGALLVLPLTIGTNFGWANAASMMFAFLTYFALSVAAVWLLMREK